LKRDNKKLEKKIKARVDFPSYLTERHMFRKEGKRKVDV
jgi:hypothetical protein